MNFDMPGWTNELGQSGLIAFVLLIAFGVVAITTLVIIWKVMRQTSTHKPTRETTAKPAKPAKKTGKPAAGKARGEGEEESDPVAEAEVFLTYGLRDQAIKVLEKHLVDNPSDKRASALLDKALKQT